MTQIEMVQLIYDMRTQGKSSKEVAVEVGLGVCAVNASYKKSKERLEKGLPIRAERKNKKNPCAKKDIDLLKGKSSKVVFHSDNITSFQFNKAARGCHSSYNVIRQLHSCMVEDPDEEGFWQIDYYSDLKGKDTSAYKVKYYTNQEASDDWIDYQG